MNMDLFVNKDHFTFETQPKIQILIGLCFYVKACFLSGNIIADCMVWLVAPNTSVNL